MKYDATKVMIGHENCDGNVHSLMEIRQKIPSILCSLKVGHYGSPEGRNLMNINTQHIMCVCINWYNTIQNPLV